MFCIGWVKFFLMLRSSVVKQRATKLFSLFIKRSDTLIHIFQSAVEAYTMTVGYSADRESAAMQFTE